MNTLLETHNKLVAELSRIEAEAAEVSAMRPTHEPETAIGSALALLQGASAIPEQTERLAALGRRRTVIVNGLRETSFAMQRERYDAEAMAMRDREPHVLQAMAAIEASLDALIAACDQLKAIQDETMRAGIAYERCRLPVAADTDIREWVAIWRRKFNETRAHYAELTAPPREPQQPKRKSVITKVKEALNGNPDAGELVAG